MLMGLNVCGNSRLVHWVRDLLNHRTQAPSHRSTLRLSDDFFYSLMLRGSLEKLTQPQP